MAITLDPLAGTNVTAPATEESSVAQFPAPDPTAIPPAIAGEVWPSHGRDFGKNPWDVAQAATDETEAQRQQSALEKIDRVALDPDSFFKGKDLTFAADPKKAQILALNSAFMEFASGDQPVPLGESDLERRLIRQDIAIRRFDGRGADSEESFHAEIVKAAQGRKDVKALGENLSKAAQTAATMALGTTGQPDTWAAARDEIRKLPGYKPEMEPDLHEAFYQAESAAREALAPFASEVKDIWQSWKEAPGAGKFTGVATGLIKDAFLGGQGETDAALAQKSTRRTAWEIYAKLKPEDQDGFMQALGVLASRIPKEEQPAFFANIAKQSGRDVETLAQQAVTTGEVLGAPTWGDIIGRSPEQEKTYQAEQDSRRRRADFVQKLQNLREGKYDPVKKVSGGWWGQLGESVAYGTTGVLATSVLASNPYTAPVLFSSLTENHYQSLLQSQTDVGISYEKASAFATQAAPLAAAIETGSEMLGSHLLRGKLPILDKALTAAMDRLTNKFVRAGTRFVAGALEEGSMEVAQNYIDPAIREIANAYGAETGKVLLPNLQDNIETMAAVFPLALLGIPGAFRQDVRAAAYGDASTTQLQALGGTAEAIAGINAAKGLSSLNDAVDTFMETRDPTTPETQAALDQIKLQQATSAKAQAALENLGYAPPRMVHSVNGIAVYDGATGEALGDAPDLNGAVKIARTHTTYLDNLTQDQVAYLGSLFESTSAALELDPNSVHDVHLDQVFDPAQATPAMAARYAQQVALQEQAEGGTGEVTRSVLGYSVTEFAKGMRTTINSLFKGASPVTVFHETFHGLRRAALASGAITRADEISLLLNHDTLFGGKQVRKVGTDLRFVPAGITADMLHTGAIPAELIPAEFQGDGMRYADTILDEGISEIAEMEVLKLRKKDGKGRLGIQRGTVLRGLTAVAKAFPEASKKWTAFFRAVRANWGLSMSRAIAMRIAEKKGEFDPAEREAFLNKLLGLDAQAEHEAAVQGELGRLMASKQDAAYHAAVESGDLATAQRMVDEAARAAGMTEVFHGTRSETPIKPGEFHVDRGAKLGPGAYFTPDSEVADGYDARGKAERYFVDADLPGYDEYMAGLSEEEIAAGKQVPLSGEGENAAWAVNSGGIEIVVRDNAHIHSAEAVVRDDAGNIVPLSERFPQSAAVVSEFDRLLGGHDVPFSIGPDLSAIAKKWEDQGAKVSLSENADTITLSRIELPESQRGQGIGTRFMNELVTYADSVKKAILLSPALDFGASSMVKLKDFYRRFGFVENKGRNKNFKTMETMIRQGESSFSLGPAEVADIMAGDALARISDPRRKTQVMSRIARDFNGMRLQIERIASLSGIRRSKNDLRNEANAREDLRAEELIADIHRRFGSVLHDADLVKIKSQPVHAYLSDPANPLRGKLMSKARAIKDHPDQYQLHREGHYDGSDSVSRSVFGGDWNPSDAAQNLFDSHLISEPTADAMWEALLTEQKMVAGMKEQLAKAQEQIRAAKLQAKQEANEWLATQAKDQEVNFSDKEEIRRSLRMLDAILLALPPEIRGKIGGYTQISMIATDDARLAYLKDKLEKADKELETYLRVEYAKEWEALLKRAAPKTNEPGQRPTGSIAADAYDIFTLAETAMGWGFAEGEAEADKWDAIADHEDTTDKDADLARVKAQMIRLTMNWTKADAARREQAVLEGEKIYFNGLGELARENSRRRERLKALRESAVAGTGKAGSRMEIKKANKDAKGSVAGNLKNSAWDFLSFGQVVNVLFGEKSAVAKWFNGMELAASNAAHDGFQAKANALEALFDTLAGDRFNGVKLRDRMAKDQTITVKDALGVEQSFSESEAITFLLMWRQEDGARHMRGIIDDESQRVLSSWSWDDKSAAEVERQLSQQGHAVLAFLGQSYGEEYGRINAVFRRIWNVSMPRHKMYAPLSVAPAQGKADTIMDPTSGDTMGTGMTPGSLKNRSFSAIAEPIFKDAFQVYLTHARQMEHFIAYGEFARDALGVINRRETRNAIEAGGGPFAARVLSNYIDFFAVGGVRDANMGTAISSFIGGALGRLSQAALVGRVSVIAMQSLQLAAAAYKMPLGAFLTRLAKLHTGQLAWGDAIRSEFIQRRLSEMPPVVRDMVQGIAGSSPNRAKYLASRAAQTISGADALFTAGTYAIFYDYAVTKQGMPPAEAHREAERLTDQVAQPTRAGARSWIEIANQGNPAFRAMWNFSSDPRQKIALVMYEKMRRDKTGADKGKGLAKALLLTWGVSGVFQAVLRAIIRDLRNDDDKEVFDERYWDPKRLALMAATGPMGGMPYIGSMLEDATYKATGQYAPAGGMLNSLGGAAELPVKWAHGKVDPLKDAETLTTAGATLSGTSAATTNGLHFLRDLWGLVDNFTDWED